MKNKKFLFIGIGVVVIILAVVILAVSHQKGNKEGGGAAVTGTPTPAAETTPTAEATPAVTEVPAVTTPAEENGNSSEDEGEASDGDDSEAPADSEITEDEAVQYIEAVLGEGYSFELLDDHLNVSDKIYYIFQVSDGENIVAPNIIVDKASGDILCYNSDGTTLPFSKHPLYNKDETSDSTGSEPVKAVISNEKALELLSQIPSSTLGLSKELKEYTIIYDDWLTKVEGADCIGINVYEKGDLKNTNVGAYYVLAKDGSKIYLYDVVKDKKIDITPKQQ